MVFFPMKNMAFPSEKKMDQDDHPPKKPRWTPNADSATAAAKRRPLILRNEFHPWIA